MNYFELYPGDYLRDTSRLSLIEHGAYMRLLMTYYAEEQPLPAALDELFVIACAVNSDGKAAVRKIADRFFPLSDNDGLRHNKRADEEIHKARRRIETSRRNGSVGGRPKRQEQNPAGYPAGIPSANPEETQQQTGSGEALPHATCHMPSSIETSTHADGVARAATAAGRACLAMRQAGLGLCNPSHPRLLEALANGVTEQELADLVREKPGKSLAWYCATAMGRRRDAPPGAPAPAAPADPAELERRAQVDAIENQIIDLRHRRDVLGTLKPEDFDAEVAKLRRSQPQAEARQ